MDTIHFDICPICSDKQIKKTFACKDYLVSNQDFDIYSCSKCGFEFTQNFPSENEIGIYYDAPEYISHTDTQKGVINSLYHKARKIALKAKVRLVKQYSCSESKKLLDIGSGTGYFLDTMRKNKWIVTGIEKSESTRLFSNKKFGLDIQNSEYLFQMPKQSKDAITMWHVLEHIEKLNTTMENLHRVLKDNGTLFIALPNKNSFDAIHYKQYWAAFDLPRHLWHFSPDNFRFFAEKHGFRVIKMKMMNFDPFYISILSEKYKNTSFATFKGFIKGFIFWFKSIFNTQKASSIIYILQKR